MSRPPAGEWEALGEPGDPVPGDPDAIALLGESLRGVADAIQQDVRDIRALAGVREWQSKAADAFRAAAGEAVSDLGRSYHRYDVAAGALGTVVREGSDGDWASAVATAQQQAAKALRAAQAARAEQQAAARQLDRLDPADPARAAVRRRHDAAGGDLAAARRELDAAKSLYAAAASRVAARIHRAITHDGMHDTFGDQVSHVAGEVEAVAGPGFEVFAGLEGVEAGIAGVVVAMVTGVGTVPGAIETGAAAADVVASAAAVTNGVHRLRTALAGQAEGDWDEEAARSLRDEDGYLRPEAIHGLTAEEMLAKKGRVFGGKSKKGSKMIVRTVRTETDLNAIWNKLSDGTPLPDPPQEGARVRRADGTLISYRISDKSGPTIDVNARAAGGSNWKIHLPGGGN